MYLFKLKFSLDICPSGIVRSYGNSIFRLRNLHTVFHSGRTNLHSHQNNCSLFYTPFPAFIICRLCDDGHSDKCEVKLHYSLDLHFSNS